MQEREVFICECSSIEHQLIVTYYSEPREDLVDGETIMTEDSLELSVHLQPIHGFLDRLWVAIKYIFGYKSQYGHWDNFLVNPKDAEKIIGYLKALTLNNKLIEEKIDLRDKK